MLLCEIFVCVALLLQYVLGFSLFFIFYIYSFWHLLPLVDLFIGLVALFFLSFFLLLKKLFLF